MVATLGGRSVAARTEAARIRPRCPRVVPCAAPMRTTLPLGLAILLACTAPASARADDAPPSPPPASAGAPATHEVQRNWLAPPKPVWPLIAMVVVAGAGVAVSAVYALKGGSDQSSVDKWNFDIMIKTGTFGSPNGGGACAKPSSADVVTACNGLTSSQNAVDTDNTLIIVGGIVTGTAVVAGVVYYFFGPGKGEKEVARRLPSVTPWVTPGASGLSVVGRF